MLLMVKREKNNWIDQIVGWNCLLKHIFEKDVEGGIEVSIPVSV